MNNNELINIQRKIFYQMLILLKDIQLTKKDKNVSFDETFTLSHSFFKRKDIPEYKKNILQNMNKSLLSYS